MSVGERTNYLEFVNAMHRGNQEQAADLLWGLRTRRPGGRRTPSTPSRSPTAPCRAPKTGHPCVKRIPNGWAAAEGHGGGRFWQAPAVAELEAGAHQSPTAVEVARDEFLKWCSVGRGPSVDSPHLICHVKGRDLLRCPRLKGPPEPCA